MKHWKWPLVWLAQWASMFAVGFAVAAADLFGAVVYGALSWGGMPLAGLVSAYRATRRGLLNYAAWLAPPIAMGLAHLILWSYPPAPGPVLFCALTSLVGAAAGEVANQRDAGKKK